MQLQKMHMLHEYLTNFNKNITFKVTEQVYLVIKGSLLCLKCYNYALNVLDKIKIFVN